MPDGAFAVKRLVGESVTVSADIIADGHDVLAAALLWRAEDEAGWHRVAMRLVVNDRWEASFAPARVGRHRFTVRAWWDTWETFRHDLAAKHAAGQAVDLEIEEGCHMIEASPDRAYIATRIRSLDMAQQIALLLSEDTARVMHAADDRPFAVNSHRQFHSMSIVRRPPSRAGTRCFRAPPPMTPRGTARSPM